MPMCDSSEIRKCPRCGASGKLEFEDGKFFVCCSKHPQARSGYADSEAEAIEKWNKEDVD